MFLNYLKNLTIKKKVKKSFSNVNDTTTDKIIKTVGIIFDESYFYEKEASIQELLANGILETDIEIIVYKDKIKKNQTFNCATFSSKDLKWNGTFDKSEINEFINKEFDLLISYYDVEKPALLLVTNLSKASFKTGFSSIDKRLNHFMIDTVAENYKVFINELFVYLKILNKI